MNQYNQTTVNRIAAFVFALSLGLPGVCLAQSDWTPDLTANPVKIADQAEKTFRTFKDVSLRADYRVRCPFPVDKKGVGTGGGSTASYFWSSRKFQIQYTVASTKAAMAGAPANEWVIRDGHGIQRRGGEVANPKFNPKSPLFNVSGDAALVEAYPTRFPKFLFSPLVGGNATLSRYIKALVRGVGGYRLRYFRRTVRMSVPGTTRYFNVTQFRILAERAKHGKRVASTVDITFNLGTPVLPVGFVSTYGPNNRLEWNGVWQNNLKPSEMPKNPSIISASH